MLKLENITKSYRGKPALHSFSMTLKPGVYGLLGPNGAGKSTMMNIITDNLRPDSGEVFWNDKPAREMGRDFRRILGYTPQQQGLYDEFTGRRFLSYIAALKEIPKAKLLTEIERVATSVNLMNELDKKLGAYSGGMKQRILIAQALLGTPELIIMDEPTAGLDPKERIRVRELLDSLGEDKVVLVATHVVSDIESIAKEIIVLRQGELVAKNKPVLLVKKYAPKGTMEDVYLKLFGEDEQPCLN